MWFTSDNAAPAHPAVMAAIAAANTGAETSYGAEPAMVRLTATMREAFEAPQAEVRLVGTGTAANALALACVCPPWATVFAHRTAHVAVDECAAPEFFTGGAKITLVDGADGRLSPEEFASALAATGEAGVHGVQRGALSLTNVTECGTVYTPDAIGRLSRRAHDAGIPVHLDGARFANALARLGCSPADASWRAGVDVLSLGGTKNGLLGVEAVVLFDPAKAWELELRRKRGGHLFSKHRFLSAQMEAFFAGGLWLELAAAANARAARLAAGLAALPGVTLLHPVEANMVFATIPEAGHRALGRAGARYYPWPAAGADHPAARLVCSWSTTEAEIDDLIAVLAGELCPDADRPVPPAGEPG